MTIRILHGDIHLHDLRTRMPFRYGIVTLTETPHAFVRLTVEINGRPFVGLAADNLPPKWFTKDPTRTLDDEIAEMLRVIEHALELAAGLEGDSPFEVWKKHYHAQAAWGKSGGLPPLLSQFGTTLVERALIEAYCRSAGRNFGELVRDNAFGIRLGDIHPSLKDCDPADLLPPRPLKQIIARHTIGLVDPLEDGDIQAAERLDDGLPQSLTACIRAYGLRHFKIKVSGDSSADRERLTRIARLLEQRAAAEYAFNLDGNENFRTISAFRAFWEEVRRLPELQGFWEHLLFVEQPWHRDVALAPEVADLSRWTDCPPVLIDESDGELASFAQALQLGYAGTSHKNCKGVFKSIAHACLVEQRRRDGRPAILSGEDLTNLGPVALMQDLAVCATLGIGSVERNGHHYFAGLSQFPPPVQRQVLAAHGDLYHASRAGWPTLTITNGALATASILAAPFGVALDLDVDPFLSVEAWRRAHPQ
jgi:hypothetical protein